MANHDDKQGKGAGEVPVQVRVTDRRLRFGAEDAEDASQQAPPERRYPSFVAEMEARMRAGEEKLAQALDLLRRRESEADEFRGRLRREMEKRSRGQVEGFLRDLLDVVDSLDRGVAAAAGETDPICLRQGLIHVRDQFLSFLARQGVEPMNLAGTDYDPHLAEALAVSPAGQEEEDNKVVEEIRRGFTIDGQVLRPAQVRVARRAEPAASATDAEAPATES